MIAAIILWGHALAALAFGVLTLAWWRRPPQGCPGAALIAALGATALWALAVAGIDAGDTIAPIMEAARNIAWLVLMLALVRRGRTGGMALTAVYAMAFATNVGAAVLAVLEAARLDAQGVAAVADARSAASMLATLLSLVLAHQVILAAPADQRAARVLVAGMVTVIGVADLGVAAPGYMLGQMPLALIALRGFVVAGGALALAMAAGQSDRALSISHGVALRLVGLAALLVYGVVAVGLTHLAGSWAGANGRVVQTAIVLGAATALLTLLSSPWLRAWAKVTVAKHLFRHRYDYRAEWQRFTATLGSPGDGADPLGRRIVRAVADLTDSPAGLLMVPDGGGLDAASGWHWEEAGRAAAALRDHLAATARIVELDQIRRGEAPAAEIAAVPAWILAQTDAWALVPLLHGASLIGVIMLARPPVDRALDWEDFDLLRVAGRQAASYLAEERAHAALADAARFDEFNRRFAFIIHDVKNLVSGMSLVARNAERHADNPEFRADMIATLRDSAGRMNTLLARLSQHHRAGAEAAGPVDVGALAARMAMARRAQHPVVAHGAGIALAQPGRLEQVIAHLVQNAVEASPPGAPVTISVGTRDGGVTVDVIDTGCGMSPAFIRDQLFRPFASSKSGGFGIGAYEARQLTEAMGGSIEVTSSEGEGNEDRGSEVRGSRFRLCLPVAPGVERAA